MDEWRVGVSKADITPPLHVPELGFIPRQHRFTGVHDRLYARALALSASDGKALLISADSIGFHWSLLGDDRNFIEELRQRLYQGTQIPPENILIAATHAHSTPETLSLTPFLEAPGAREWVGSLLNVMVMAGISAWRERKPAIGYVAEGNVFGIGWSRRILSKDGKAYRRPYRPADDQVVREEDDPSLGLVLFVREDGLIVLTHFTAHPTVVQVNDQISADYPGALTHFVDANLPGCLSCLFFQGACGDVNTFYQTTSNFQDVRDYGTALACEALKHAHLIVLHHRHQWDNGKALGLLTKKRPWRCAVLTPSVIATIERRVLPPRSDLPDPQTAERSYLEALSLVGGDRWWMRSDRPLSQEEKSLGQMVLTQWNRWQTVLRAADERNRTVEVQVIALGPLALVGVSGELFVGPGNRIKASSSFPFTWVVGYANGYVGYLTDTGAFDAGGYEVSLGPWTACADGSGDIVADMAHRLLAQVRSKIKGSVDLASQRTHPTSSEMEMSARKTRGG